MATESSASGAVSWQVVAIGACGIVLSGGGYIIGDTLTDLRTEIRDVRQTLDQRSSIPPRLESVERQADDQERRLREVEIRLGHQH